MWKRSSFAKGATPIVRHVGDKVYVRSSEGGGTLVYTIEEWDAFVKGVKAGEFN